VSYFDHGSTSSHAPARSLFTLDLEVSALDPSATAPLKPVTLSTLPALGQFVAHNLLYV
jgi:hypothetical protein